MTKINGTEVVQTTDASLIATRYFRRNHETVNAACNDFFARRGINAFEQLTSFFPKRLEAHGPAFKPARKKKRNL